MNAARSAAAAAVGVGLVRAWTIASGAPAGPTRSPGAATSLSPTAWSIGVGLVAAAAAEVDDGEADGADVDAGDDAGALRAGRDGHRRGRQVRRRGARGGRRARRARRPCGEGSAAAPTRSAARRVAVEAPRRSSSRHSSTVTSSRRGSLAAPVRWSIDSRTSSALPAVRPSTRSMSVISARGRAARCPPRRR